MKDYLINDREIVNNRSEEWREVEGNHIEKRNICPPVKPYKMNELDVNALQQTLGLSLKMVQAVIERPDDFTVENLPLQGELGTVKTVAIGMEIC